MKIRIIFLLLSISFFGCGEALSDKEKETYINRGKNIAQISFNELSTQLTAQMQQGGPAQAIPFCNVQASPIVKNLEKVQNASIKRTSDKTRSKDNAPTKREMEILEIYSENLKNKVELTPMIEIDIDKKKHFYAPIIINDKCLACHGKLNETLSVKTDSIIKALYPKDLATGYSAGDLRGIWSITFND
jgi:hypothetical protein